jgi:hypothetical protein
MTFEELQAENARLRSALTRIASDHKDSPQFPGGHIWSAQCDACRRQEIAKEALGTDQPSPRSNTLRLTSL